LVNHKPQDDKNPRSIAPGAFWSVIMLPGAGALRARMVLAALVVMLRLALVLRLLKATALGVVTTALMVPAARGLATALGVVTTALVVPAARGLATALGVVTTALVVPAARGLAAALVVAATIRMGAVVMVPMVVAVIPAIIATDADDERLATVNGRGGVDRFRRVGRAGIIRVG